MSFSSKSAELQKARSIVGSAIQAKQRYPGAVFQSLLNRHVVGVQQKCLKGDSPLAFIFYQ
jgi:hypothetical protein